MKRIALAVALLVSLAAPAWAGSDECRDAFQAAMESADSDFETSLRECKPLAEAGDADAQTRLAWMYRAGKSVSMDWVEAERWYRMAAEQGSAEAQVALGNMHYRCGREIISSCASATPMYPGYTEAVKWYRKAADLI